MPDTTPGPPRPAPRRRAAPFRPRFTIGIAYLAGFTILFMLLMLMPDLLGVLAAGGDELEMQRRAEEVARANARPQVALGLALLATALGGYFEVLPGLRQD